VAQDWKKAVEWYEKAAEQGHKDAKVSYERCLKYIIKQTEKPTEDTKTNSDKSLLDSVYTTVSFPAGGGGVLSNGTIVYPHEINLSDLISSAESGDVIAQRELGRRYSGGIGLERDMTKAEYWCEKASEQGDIEALHLIASFYGSFLTAAANKDPVRCAYWDERAATLGYIDSQVNTAVNYALGYGVKQDWSVAAYWFKKAADQGHKEAKKSYEEILKSSHILTPALQELMSKVEPNKSSKVILRGWDAL
jgi:hypothetical protein